MIICKKCGAYNDDHRLICSICKEELECATHSNYIPKRENPPAFGESSDSSYNSNSNYSSSSIICSNCGTRNDNKMDYCFNCGKSLYGAGVINESTRDKFIKNFFIGLAVTFIIAVIVFFVLYLASLIILFIDDSPNDVNSEYNIAFIEYKDLQT